MRFNDRVLVYQNQAAADGFGGNTGNPVLLASSWANVRTIPREKLLSGGLNADKGAIRILCRFRNDLDYTSGDLFIRYKGKDWTIRSVEQVNLDDDFVKIIAEL